MVFVNLLTPVYNNTTKGISLYILKCSSLGERIEKMRSQQLFHTNVLSFAKHFHSLSSPFQQFSEGMVILYPDDGVREAQSEAANQTQVS